MQDRKLCVIAGVGPGNGAAFARRFARAGYHVAMLARTPGTIDALAREIAQARAYVADVSIPHAVQAAFGRIREELGPIDVLIHNASSFAKSPFVETTPEEFEAQWRNGPWSLLLCARQAVASMLERGRGVVIAIGATASLRGSALFASFAASKAAHRSLAQSMARSLGRHGVHVGYVIIDGILNTARIRRWLPQMPDEAFIEPSGVAEAVFQLAEQPRSSWTFELDVRTSEERW